MEVLAPVGSRVVWVIGQKGSWEMEGLTLLLRKDVHLPEGHRERFTPRPESGSSGDGGDIYFEVDRRFANELLDVEHYRSHGQLDQAE
ncbi:hypothetical protein JTB14_017485 [Gonioctena quinquepunctata]|nr:hypothetical protein JTB14_017485 [Gonioctena quinquepunctata]